jgi:peptidoglycan hydrolase CwlO-like protein
MTRKIVIATILAVVLVLAASVVWADHIDKEIARQQSVIDQGISSGKIDSYDGTKLNRYLSKIQKRTTKVRERGRYTPQEIKKLETYLHRSNTNIQKSIKK